MLDPTTIWQNRSRHRRLALTGLLLTTGMMTAFGIAAEYRNPFVFQEPKRLPAVKSAASEESQAESSSADSNVNETSSPGLSEASPAAALDNTIAGLFAAFTPGPGPAQDSTTNTESQPELNPAQGVSEQTKSSDAILVEANPKIIVEPSPVAVRKRIAESTAHAEPNQRAEGPRRDQPNSQSANSAARPDGSTSWLRSNTSAATHEKSRRLLKQASHEYSVGAWFSAEASAWEALRWAAESIEGSRRENCLPAASQGQFSAVDNLNVARHAIREARDFAGHYGALDVHAIRRMVMSHQTKVLVNQPLAGVTATDAVDRYLDDARVRLSRIAGQSIEAAEAMDLLAAIYLGRNDANTLPSSTALCLRRAALQGQPMNASLAARLGMHLADLGLFQEARWALEHSLSIEPGENTANSLAAIMRQFGENADAERLMASIPNRRPSHGNLSVPKITRLTPQEFASVSTPVMQVARKQLDVTSTGNGMVRRSISKPTADQISEPKKKPVTNVVQRFFGSMLQKF